MGVLSGLLAAMATSTALTLYTHVGGGAVSLGDEHKFFQELPELVISLFAVLFVVLLGRILSARQTQSQRLYEAEEKLRSNEARLRVMLEQMPAIVWTTDLELRFSSSAGAALNDLGLEADQVVGHTLYDFFKTTDKKFPAIAAHLQALEGKSVAYEQDWGGQRYRVVVETMHDTEGEIVGVLGVALDVTDLVVSERALMASEARYQDFLVQTSEGIWRVELDESIAVEASEDDQIEHFYRYGSLAECSDAFAKMFGLTSASVLVDARLDEILPRDDRNNLEHLRTFIRRDYRLAEAYSSEQDDNGRNRHFIHSLTGIVEDGQLLRIWGIRRDVTDHKEADRALKASEEKYRELFEVSQDTIFISTPEGRLIDINPSGVRLLGYASREELSSGINIPSSYGKHGSLGAA